MQQLLPTCGEKAEHAQTVHNVEVTPELAEQVKSLIRDK